MLMWLVMALLSRWISLDYWEWSTFTIQDVALIFLDTETVESYEYHLRHANWTSILDLDFVSLALSGIGYLLSSIIHPWLAATKVACWMEPALACWISKKATLIKMRGAYVRPGPSRISLTCNWRLATNIIHIQNVEQITGSSCIVESNTYHTR